MVFDSCWFRSRNQSTGVHAKYQFLFSGFGRSDGRIRSEHWFVNYCIFCVSGWFLDFGHGICINHCLPLFPVATVVWVGLFSLYIIMIKVYHFCYSRYFRFVYNRTKGWYWWIHVILGIFSRQFKLIYLWWLLIFKDGCLSFSIFCELIILPILIIKINNNVRYIP